MTEGINRILRKFGYRLRKLDPHHRPDREVEQFAANTNNPYLISFPRTGSHWLRMLIERYFEQPCLVRTFYYPGRSDYLLCHDHDMELQLDRQNVIYLYRDPVDTVYSQLNYYKEPYDNRFCVAHWSTRYALHTAKWMIERKDQNKLTILRYERLKNHLPVEFSKLVRHFGRELDAARLESCAAAVTKTEVTDQSKGHNPRVMTVGETYEEKRKAFRAAYRAFIIATIADVSQRLYNDADRLPALFE